MENKPIVDHTSPALCTPITLFSADPICSERVTMHCHWERKPPKTVPSPLNFVTLPEEDRATAIGNMHTKIDKDRACGSRDILAERERHKQTHTPKHTHRQHSSQYFDSHGRNNNQSYTLNLLTRTVRSAAVCP